MGVVLVWCLLAAAAAPAAEPTAPLVQGFRQPPDSARPHTWWHWMNGNVSREGITADLEAMRRVGVGGVQIFTVDQGIPAGSAGYLGDEWRALFKFALEEARRLGIEVGMHNCAGWSSSGGPWITPELAMQRVVTSEVRVTGGVRFSEVLPQPPTKLGFYRDIAVLAFLVPESEQVNMLSFAPVVTGSSSAFDGSAVVDASNKTFGYLPKPTPDKPQHLLVEFEEPFTARRLVLVPGEGLDWMTGTLEVSDDGQTFTEVADMTLRDGWNRRSRVYGFPAVTGRFFRLRLTEGSGQEDRIALAEVQLSPRFAIENFEAKAGDAGSGGFGWDVEGSAPPETVVSRRGIVDLTRRMSGEGRLTWNVPPGTWMVVRVGYTPTGRKNHPAPPEGTGLECDKLSAAAADAHFAAVMGKLLPELGELAGPVFANFLIDSYEVGNQNWTRGFKKEFRRRRGYDPTPYLAVLTNRVVESLEVSERFLWDLRRTIADLFQDRYYGRMAKLCHRRGLRLGVEPYGGPFESLGCGGRADLPVGEFWVSGGSMETCKLAASVGHTYGRSVIGAEAFTAMPHEGAWRNDPGSLKMVGDRAFCRGVNRLIFHTYAHQPWLDRLPGMTMGPWGTRFGRTNTWWEQSAAWMSYLARCQFLLQQGTFVADAVYFCGEGAPVGLRAGPPELPDGYDYDVCNAEVILTRMSTRNGRLTLPGGLSYRVLVLPPDGSMTLKLLRKLGKLVQVGATVVGPKPVRSPSLEDYPKCDRIVASLADKIWGDCDGKTVTEHGYGKGKVIWGKPLAEVFAGMGVSPDFEFSGRGARVDFIHRVIDGADVYFVSNQRARVAKGVCTFRVTGKVPELWHPETGRIETAPVYEERDGRIALPLRLDPAESVFVVFRRPASGADHVVHVRHVGAGPEPLPPTLEIRRAIYEAEDGSGFADVTDLLRGKVKDGSLLINAENDVLGGDPTPEHFKRLRVEYVLDGQVRTASVREHETLQIGGRSDPASPPPWRAGLSAEGMLELAVREAGAYEARTAQGKTMSVEVGEVAEPLGLAAPWEVRFPPGRGAPDRITLQELISWSEHQEDGVRFFSGTAAYLTEFEVPPELRGTATSLVLDLGEVKNLAEIRLNGHDLGVLWKRPFRIDVSDAVRTGANRLEVRVTNLWPNRLIGDAKLPEDCEWGDYWAGKHLQAWPAWLKAGKPSPTGRLTFTTWKHWSADSPLLDSGLLGPVVLYPARRVRFGPPGGMRGTRQGGAAVLP